MLRLTPPGMTRIEAATSFDVQIGGAESNVAVALARLGKRSAWMSRLPDSPPGHLIANTIRGYGVDIADIRWADPAAGERVGTYYLERGAPPRSARVWYDRAASAASRLRADDLPLERIAGARWLHVTGITVALSESCADAVAVALRHARAHGVRTSLDINYRALLWPPERAARTLEPLCALADVVFIAERDARLLFGTADIAALQSRWGGAVSMTHGADGARMCGADGALTTVPAFPVTLVERLGAGDAFAAGVLCGLLEGATSERALRLGCACAALKLTIPGDFALVTRAEVEALLNTAAGSSAAINR